MQFTTPIPIDKNEFPIDYSSKVMSIGSCFAVNMAEKLDYFKFQNSCNPVGILFHPLAIEKLIDFAVSQKKFTENDIFFYNERWHCFDVHSDLSNSNKEELLASLNALIKSTNQQITESTHFIITYGTSWVYRNIESDSIVANCHKVPQKQFKKELLSVEEIEKSIANTLKLIHAVNPNCTVVFTVSPVRHIKDGFVENQWSKANLFSAIHSVLKNEHSKMNTEYFPSYEIMMDELRDYRFYAEDMLHPNQVAIDYIWKRFKETTISEAAFNTMDEVENVQKSLSHKPFNPNSESHLKFESKVREKITKLENQYSFMKF
ncbi:GSCFA domain-containing protein [Flavobacterium glaciei]|uniref:GSCFA family protein n=1 Tax=Flavobacterium glaciei TaxID=386300 RepID=A0A562PL40_9FLAO|nr:GSCFA domain-containing protein [Flavobacterium glaciei]RDI51414.1 GSCFA family protein [Flavobacterium glaciei]TWI45137.1 GSCFA family protein [Flavobacterium glaciei]